MKEEIKIEELNGMELLKLIYEEVKNNREEIQKLREEFEQRFKDLEKRVTCLEEKVNRLEEKVNRLEEKVNRLEEKINYMDEKIDNTKKQLVLEIAEELKDFSAMTTKTIINLEKKIDNEIEDRKVDVSKIKEFNRIIINDIRGRVSILEEESERYNLN